MNLSRRGFLTGLSLIAAPAIIRPGFLMPVRTWHDGIRGEIGWVVEPLPLTSGDTYFNSGDRLYRAVISDGRRWHPLLSRLDLARPANWASRLIAAPLPVVDGPVAICA